MQKNYKIYTNAIENGSRDYQGNKWGNKKASSIVTRNVDTLICPFANIRYLYQPGELEGGGRRRATDPIWFVDVHKIDDSITSLLFEIYSTKKRFFAPLLTLLKKNYSFSW